MYKKNGTFLTFITLKGDSHDVDIIKYDVYRGPNLGVYLSVNDTIGLVPMGFAKSKADKLAEYLDVKISLYRSCQHQANRRAVCNEQQGDTAADYGLSKRV